MLSNMYNTEKLIYRYESDIMRLTDSIANEQRKVREIDADILVARALNDSAAVKELSLDKRHRKKRIKKMKAAIDNYRNTAKKLRTLVVRTI